MVSPDDPAWMSHDPSASDRLAALDRYGILDTPAEAGFDDIALLACQICDTPVALVSLVAGDRQWFKAKVGFDACQTPLDQSVCRHSLARPGLLVISDLTADPRTRDNELVTGEPHLRFYAGARLETSQGLAIGTLCIVDSKPRPRGLTESQATALEALARQVMVQLELRSTARAPDRARDVSRESAVRHERILESAVDFAILATDRDGIVTDWNAGAEHLFGWSRDEMIGQAAECCFAPEDRAAGRFAHEMRGALAQNRGTDERWCLKKDGSRFWAGGATMPLRDAGGGLAGFTMILRDETLRHEAVEKLRRSEEFLQNVLASSDDCIKVLDLDANLLFMSEGGRRVMEVDDFNAIRGCPWPSFWTGDKNAEALAAIEAAKSGRTGHFQGIATTMAGNPRSWDVRVMPILDPNGRPERLLSISRDITATAQAERALRESEAHWRGLFERLREGFILGELVRDATGRVTDWRYRDVNQAWGDLVGIRPEDAKGRTIREVFPGIEDDRVDEMAAVIETGEPALFARQVGTLDRWYEGRAFRLEGDRFAALFLEVTARRRTEVKQAAILELGDRLRDLADPAEMAFAAAEIMGRALRVARAGYGTVDPVAETILIERGWTMPGIASLADKLSFRDFGGYIADLKAGRVVDIADTVLDARTAPQAAALERIGIRAIINLPILEHGQLVTVFYLNSDVPRVWSPEEIAFTREVADRTRSAIERRSAEMRLRDLNMDLETRVLERTQALMQAEEQLRQAQKMEAVGQLTGGVAHDFNNLLTVIRSSVDLLKRPNLAEERRQRYIEAIADTTTRAAKLTGQLLAFARRQTLKPETFDVVQGIGALRDMVRTLTGSRIRIDTDVPETPCFIDADPSQFDTALVNLVVNARDAMDGEGRLTITVRAVSEVPRLRAHPSIVGDFVAVSVTDTGTGIAEANLERIFEPFFTTKGVGQGTGLGLSQVFGFTKQSGGEVGVASELGRGTTFTLYLPRVSGSSARAEREEASGPVTDGHGLHVLVVEDNRDIGAFATQTLQELGFTTGLAGDADAALAVLAGGVSHFDVVFSDVVMPGMNGIELGQEIRRRHPGLPVVLTSGYSHVLAQNGTAGFELLQKPYSVEDLSRVLRQAVGGKVALRP